MSNIESEIIDNNTLRFQAKRNEVPEIVSNLVKANIKIYKLSEDQTSLEDAFLKKTGGNIIE